MIYRLRTLEVLGTKRLEACGAIDSGRVVRGMILRSSGRLRRELPIEPQGSAQVRARVRGVPQGEEEEKCGLRGAIQLQDLFPRKSLNTPTHDNY